MTDAEVALIQIESEIIAAVSDMLRDHREALLRVLSERIDDAVSEHLENAPHLYPDGSA